MDPYPIYERETWEEGEFVTRKRGKGGEVIGCRLVSSAFFVRDELHNRYIDWKKTSDPWLSCRRIRQEA